MKLAYVRGSADPTSGGGDLRLGSSVGTSGAVAVVPTITAFVAVCAFFMYQVFWNLAARRAVKMKVDDEAASAAVAKQESMFRGMRAVSLSWCGHDSLLPAGQWAKVVVALQSA